MTLSISQESRIRFEEATTATQPVAMIRQEPHELPLSFKTGYDDLDDLNFATLSLPSGDITALVRHQNSPTPGTEICITPNETAIASLVVTTLHQLHLTKADLTWVHPLHTEAIQNWVLVSNPQGSVNAMNLTPTELQTFTTLLQTYAPAQPALTTLTQTQGNLDTTFNTLWASTLGNPRTYSPDQSLWQVTLAELRRELCGDDSFRTKLNAYSKNPTSATLLTGVIVYVTEHTQLPLDPAMATVFVLFILKIGLNIFCEYTKAT